jgi:hypothetical protein
MNADPKLDPHYAEAHRHVMALKGFYIHALVYACVMSGLLGLNMILSGDWWVHWPAAGWGFALLVHAVVVLVPFDLFGRDWQERKIAERLGRR